MAEFTLKTSEGETLELELNLFEGIDRLNLNSLLRIDYQNIAAEKITFPSVLTRFAFMFAQAKSRVREAELSYVLWESKEKQKIRDKWQNDPERPIVRGGKYTNDQVEAECINSKLYKIKKQKINRLTTEQEIADALFWGAKRKMDELESIDWKVSIADVRDTPEFNNIKVKLKSK
jgi:hypothetical protein